MQMSIMQRARGAFPCCIVVVTLRIRERIDIRKEIRDIRSNLSTRYRRARRLTSLSLPRSFAAPTDFRFTYRD